MDAGKKSGRVEVIGYQLTYNFDLYESGRQLIVPIPEN
jgi:hypothetical protein